MKPVLSCRGTHFLAIIGLAFCMSVDVCSVQADEDGHSLRAGIVKVDITPETPVKMAGYAGRTALSTGIHDRLYARVTAFQSGKKRLVLVSTDLIGFYEADESFRAAIRERFDLQPGELFLSSIHTHSGPTPMLENREHPNNVEYTRKLKATLLDAITQAFDKMGPVWMGAGRGHSPVGSNRREKRPNGEVVLGRNPYGPTDKEVVVMKLTKPDGTPVAAAFDYATHATSLGPRNLLISGDVLGIAAQFVEKILAPDVIAPVFAGASGDIDPWYRVLPSFETEKGWIPEPELLGILLGEEVVHVFRDIKSTSPEAEIKTAFRTLKLPGKKMGDGEEDPPAKELNVTVARIGDVAFVGVGCELLTEIGMAIKAGSPCKYTFLITHCNGAAGYLPPEHLYGEGGYEIRSTRFGPEAGEVLVREVAGMLEGLE